MSENTDWHWADVKAALEKAGHRSLRELDRKNGLPETTTSQARLGRGHRLGENVIAAALGMLPQQIWPSRYPNTRQSGAE
ncbi:MAG: helix-turn-helix domain-containing protein [Magnetococcales bacterium]|nr:helix-turn-helix domain-containing protein [Magnetococcales bacterium]